MLNQCYVIIKFLAKYLSILLLLLIAVYVLATRVALSLLPDYKTQITSYFSELIDLPVHIGSFHSSWEGLNPVLQINNLIINGQDQLAIERVSVQFAFWKSVLTLSPRLENIFVENTELAIHQQTNGQWYVLIEPQSADEKKRDNDVPALFSSEFEKYAVLFNGTTINLRNVNATIYKHYEYYKDIRLPYLNVNYEDQKIFASGQVLESLGGKKLLNFSLKSRDLFSDRRAKGTLYVEARSSEFFGELIRSYQWNTLSIQDIDANARAWINFEGFDIDSVYGDLQVRALNWNAGENSLDPLHDLALNFLYSHSSLKKQLAIADVAFELGNIECEPGDIKLTLKPEVTAIAVEMLPLNCFNRLAQTIGILSEELALRLNTSDPHGMLHNIHLALFNPDEETTSDNNTLPKRFEFEAQLDKVTVKAYESTPSGENLSGYVYVDEQSGFISFLSEDFKLGFPKLFLDTWDFSTAEGHVAWILKDDEIDIYSKGLRLWRSDKSLLYGDFQLLLNPEHEENYLSLAVGIQDIAVNDAFKFIPYHEIDPDLYQWLSGSLKKGLVSNGVYYGYGSVEDDVVDNSFTSSLYLATVQASLMFDPDWPALEELDADLFLQNGQLLIDGKQAKIEDTRLTKIHAFLPKSLPEKGNAIMITANALLSTELINYWLSDSPIAMHTIGIAEQLTIRALADTRIDLKIPVAQPEPISEHLELDYAVRIKLNDAQIKHIPANLTFKDVHGEITVDSKKGISAKSLKLRLFEQAARLNIVTENTVNEAKDSEKYHSLTKIILEGELMVKDIFGYFDAHKPAPLTGQLAYLATLSISDQDGQHPLLSIESDLTGLSCACPAPFEKIGHQKQHLNLSLLLKPDQSYLHADLTAFNRPSIRAELLFMDEKLSFGEILIGGGTVSDTQLNGLNIAAKLEQAHLQEWLNFLSEILDPKQTSHDQSMITSMIEGTPQKDKSPVKKIQLEINQINAFDYAIEHAKLLIAPFEDEVWQIGIDSADAIGNVTLASKGTPLKLDFAKLNLRSIVTDPPVVKNDDILVNASRSDPRDLPALQFSVKKLLLENRNLGSWQFDIEPIIGGAIFRELNGHFKGTNISGQLSWRVDNDIHNTITTLDVSGNDVTAMFDLLDLPSLINSSKYNADIALVWPSAPYDFSMAMLSGKLALNFKDGFIKTEDEKTGALRLFGLLNAESIKRRLKLDFSDLYKSGIGYDDVTATASIDNGLLTLTKPMLIEGPAGNYVLNGRSDLASKTLDIDMLVELPFSQNVPLAALVLGAPQLGGLVWVADKLLGEPLSALTTSRYDITGPWDKPRVNLKQAVGASKKDRSNEKGKRDSADK